MLALTKDIIRYKCISYTTSLRMVKALGISECSKVNKCILHANPLHRSFLRYKCILSITVLRMVKAFGISACSKVNMRGSKNFCQGGFRSV